MRGEPGDLGADVPGVEVAAGQLAQPRRIDTARRPRRTRRRPAGRTRSAPAAAAPRRRPAATSPSSCEPKDSAAISRPAGLLRARRRACCTSAAVHSAGSCSAQPASRIRQLVRRVARGDQRPVGLERLRARALGARRRPRRRAARSALLLARAAAQQRERERVDEVVLARDEHGDAVGRAVDLVDREQQRPARDVEAAWRRRRRRCSGVRWATPWSTARPRSASAA